MRMTLCYYWATQRAPWRKPWWSLKNVEFSGLVINWTKSSIMLLDSTPDSQSPTLQDIPITPEFKYLGVYVTPQPRDYVSLNVCPLLSRINDKIKVWSKLKMSLVGRVNLTKMIFMPQLLYMLHNTPMVGYSASLIPCSDHFSGLIDLRELNWNNSKSPRRLGGLALSKPLAILHSSPAPTHRPCDPQGE